MAHWLTVGIGVAAVAGSLYLRSIWMAYLAARGLIGSARALRFDGALDRAWKRWDALDFATARLEAQRAAERATDTLGRARALELLVFTCLATRDAAGAKAAYEAYPTQVGPSALLRAIVALDTEDHAKAAELFRGVPEGLFARVLIPLVVSWGTSGWEERAMAWLEPATFEALPRPITKALGAALFYAGCYRLSERLHELRFGTTKSPHDAYNVACSLAKEGRGEAALAWLERALDAGWTDVATMDGDDDLKAVRVLDGYAGLRRRIAGAA